MNSFTIKLIACASMFADHFGVVLYPDSEILRIIGRMAFPMFAFLIAEGARKTHDINSYFLRMFLFALVSQYPYKLAFPDQPFNIFFTLSAGLMAIILYNRHKKLVHVGLVTICALAADLPYGGTGVFTIFLFYFLSGTPSRAATAGFFSTIILWVGVFLDAGPNIRMAFYQPFAILSVPIIRLYNGSLGPKCKWAFYLFYPVHLVLLFVLKQLYFT